MNTDTTFFLAANSGRGLASFYEDFPGRGVFLHIVKGGPGTGKSGFMRRIRAAAAARGLDTESILCSGDPDSLDALVIPALAQAWMDGTAPHVREPGILQGAVRRGLCAAGGGAATGAHGGARAGCRRTAPRGAEGGARPRRLSGQRGERGRGAAALSLGDQLPGADAAGWDDQSIM